MMYSMRNSVRLALVAAMLAVAPATWADEHEEMEAGGLDFSASAGVDITTHYFFRGIFQENQSWIVQPYGEVSLGIWEGEGFINSVGVTIGTWHSLHGGPSGEDNPGGSFIDGAWYEADLYGGVTLGLPENFSTSITYTAYLAPDDAFDTIQDVAFSLDYDDSSWWGDSGFSLSPSFTAVVETSNEADQGNTVTGIMGGDQGTYYQFAITPSFPLFQSEDYPITASIPVIVGLGDDYYEIDHNGDGVIDDDETFGFASVGTFLSMPLAFIPGGDWTVSAGATYLFLGNNTKWLNDDGDSFEVIGTLSLGVSW